MRKFCLLFVLLLVFPTLLTAQPLNRKQELERKRIQKINSLRTSDISLLNSYLDLMVSKKLIDQSDKRLEKRKLLVDGGGLCAFTAQINAIQATSKYFGFYKKELQDNPDQILDEVIEEAGFHMKEDPAYAGTGLLDLTKYANEVLAYYGLEKIVNVKYSSDMSKMNPEKFNKYYWKMRLLGMLSKNEKEGHTIVLLKVDAKRKILYASDPNYPNEVVEIPYSYKNGKLLLTLSLDFPGFQPALVDEVIELNVQR